MSISNEAVEAAHEQLDAMGSYVSHKYVAAALEASAPYMLAGALAQIDAGEQVIPSNPLANTGLSDAVTWSEVREWLSSL